MCNRYTTPEQNDIERLWDVSGRNPLRWAREVFPRAAGPFIRLNRLGQRELVTGCWGLIPHFAKTADIRYSTNNARSEEVANKPSFRQPWAKGQRCIIPAQTFDEPNWETGRNVWWRFRRADGLPWGLAGLWNTWTDPQTGEIHESYTMLTLSADAHPLMRRMHKPDPKLPADQQDKRSVVPIELIDVELWLSGAPEEAQRLLCLTPESTFDGAPA